MLVRCVAVGCDHAGIALKKIVSETLNERAIEILDLGTDGLESVDYPDFGYSVARAVADGGADRGVLMCGSGIGISIAANRHPKIRAALVHDKYSAQLCREHNDANVLCFGGRVITPEIAKSCLEVFLDTEFSTGERHERRVRKLCSPVYDAFEQ